MQMARNGKDLEAVSWLGIVVLDAVHVFQGEEQCGNECRQRNKLYKNRLLSKMKIIKAETIFLLTEKNFFEWLFLLKLLKYVLIRP